MMKNITLQICVLLVISFLSSELVAQSDIALSTRKAELKTLSEKLKKRDVIEQQQAREFARRAGIPVRRELPDGRVLELQRIAPGIGPVFYITNNVDAADTVSTDEVWPGGSTGLDLDGGGMVVGEWDGGAIASDHPDFTGRLTQVDGATVVSGHSTHVAGTLVGSGGSLFYPEARGMAYAAHLNAYDWNSDTAEMALAASNGLLVSNHSYGIAAGWLYTGEPNPPDTWWWIGGADPAIVEDSNFGYYDSETQLWDQIAYDAPYYLIVKAAGNDRTDIGPSPGEEYTIIDQNGDLVGTSTAPRMPDCAPAGYDCLPTGSVAKNILTVGAVDDVIGGYSPFSGSSSVQMADFSGWGPTDDGRIKPDVVGNGMFLVSTYPAPYYFAAGAGTSMAAPNVSGSLILLQELYQDRAGTNNFMRAATLKALAINTADEAGGADGPDYAFGWGLLNTKNAAQVITGNGGAHQIIEGSLFNGVVDTIEFNVTQADAIVTATLVWADPAGTPVAPVLDPPDIMLVNDLDLRVKKAPATFFPWVLNPAIPAQAATRGDNFRDNVEQVVSAGAGTGSYFIEVSHKGTLQSGTSQDYSLIISVRTSPPTGSGLFVDEDFTDGLPAGWSVVTTRGIDWTFNTPVTGDNRLDNNTGGAGNFAMVDNDYSYNILTSLRTPVLDLSSAVAVVLRFKSFFWAEEGETVNVDVSTDGGSVWNNVWSTYNFSPYPELKVLDLTGVAAGQAGFMLGFRYDSGNGIRGNLWQIDDVELEVFGGEPPPVDTSAMASSPGPADGASDIEIASDLSWLAGSGAVSHNVYFGTVSPIPLQGNQAGTSFDPGTLAYATTYLWRIDEVNGDGTTAGNTWSFSTGAAPAQTMNLAGLSGGMTPASRGRWNAVVAISAEDQGNSPEAGVTIEGAWSNGSNGTSTCTTLADGGCTVTKQNLKGRVSSVTFTVTNLSKTGMVYEPADNVGSASITVSQSSQDLIPVAVNDSYPTDVDTPVSGNVISNDNQGDGPASISGNTQPSNGSLSLASNGAFTYTPVTAFTGTDTFTYSISDQDGDTSNSATVSMVVSGAEPPPSVDPSVSLRPFKVKGKQRVEVTWLNFVGSTVEITRDGNPVQQFPTANDGSYEDNIGAKGGGQVYNYRVCATETGICVDASTGF